MSTDRANDLRAFRGFIDEKLGDIEAEITLDEALVRWEIENQGDEARDATVAAIRQGLADAEVGRVMPAREALAELRRKYGQP